MLARATRTATAVLLASAVVLGATGCSVTDLPTSSTGGTSSPQTPRSTPVPSATPTAVVTIAGVDVDGQHVSVSGYVNGVVEDGGVCTFTMTAETGKPSVVITSTGLSNATTTSCGTNQVPIGSFSRGSWSVVLDYRSLTATAESAPTTFEIP